MSIDNPSATALRGDAKVEDAPKQKQFYRPELDSLRFCAFFAVFIFHALPHDPAFFIERGLPNAVSNVAAEMVHAGAFGVDLFFCLSAYLISSLLIREFQREGRVDIGAFYVRRILRIWPLYCFAIILFMIILPALGVLGDLSTQRTLAFSFFVGNWYLAFGGNGGDGSHLWSISFEEQFYLLWPLLIILFGVARLWKLAIAALIVGFAVRMVAINVDASPIMRWTNSFLRLEPLAVGILLSVLVPPGFNLGRKMRFGTFLAGASLPVVCLMVFGLNNSWDLLTYPLIALGCGLLLVSFLAPANGLLANPVTTYLGKISFGLYVFHPLSLGICGALLNSNVFIAAFLLNIGIAASSYHLLEMPFLRLKARYEAISSRPI